MTRFVTFDVYYSWCFSNACVTPKW